MKKRLILGMLAIFLLILPFSYAEGFDISAIPVKDRIVKGEWAVFDLRIENNQSDPDIFKLGSKVEGTEWSLLTESTFDYATGVAMNPHSTKIVRILLKDKDLDANTQKAYVVDLSAKSSNTNEKKTALMKIFLLPGKDSLYAPDITVSPNIPRYIDPQNIYYFIVNIRNNNLKDMKNLQIKLESSTFTRESSVELLPEMQKAVEFTVGFDKGQKPLLDTLTITISEDGEELYRETMPIEIVSYRLPFKQDISMTEYFLKTVEELTVTNKETVQQQQRVLVPLSRVEKFFIKTEPGSFTVREENRNNLGWDVKLKPEESAKLTITTDYRPVFYALLALFMIIIIYYVFRNPIVALKHAETIATKEGGISELKVVLNIKNRSKNQYGRVTVIDRIPDLIDVDKKHDLGSLIPTKIIRSKGGTMLRWELEMDSHEERLIKYMVKARLSILGNMTLPPALVFIHGEKDSDSKKRIRSNTVNLSQE